MRLIIENLPIKGGWRDAQVAAWDLAEAIWQNIYKKPIVFNGLSSKFNPSQNLTQTSWVCVNI